jgi:selenocysteine lyase/cysteine desulfurase
MISAVESFPDAAGWQAWRRQHFPVFNHKIFLTHASVSPLPKVVADAISSYADRASQLGQWDAWHDEKYFQCKERIARLVGAPAQPSQIAFASSTSHAIGLVATSLPWKSGDNCIVADGDFPANVIPWKNLQFTHGVETRVIPGKPERAITIADIEPLLDENTRIVSLASANFLSGIPLDINTIGRWLQERKVLFCIDGIQTLGAVRFDATYVDFVCADAHKWLLAPNGIAFLWAREERLQTMRPAILGWLAVQDRDRWLEYDTTPINSAERFEPGSRNYTGIIALDAALQIFENLQLDRIEKHITALRQYAFKVLLEKNCRLLWQPVPHLPGGIISFQPPGGDATSFFKKTEDEFMLSLRGDKSDEKWIRLSPHFMNCEDDFDKLAKYI